jgi:uncharacterized protein
MIITDKVYGKQKVDNSLIVELLGSPELERLKGVGQYGTWYLLDKKFDTNRFEHSFGVYVLLKKFGADLNEQVAGLLHDVNHTAFSHVVDYVLGDPSTQEFGDSKHKNIILSSSIPKILEKHGIDVHKVSDHHSFGLLDNDLPDLCCDRLDYCLRDSVCCGFIDMKGVADILNNLYVYEGEIICSNKESAHRLASLFLKMSKFLWSNELQAGSYLLLAEALKVAVKEGIVSVDDFYTTDNVLFDKLMGSGNSEIVGFINSIKKDVIVPGTKDDHDIFSRSKARYVDPKFVNGGSVKRLSDVDMVFKREVDEFKDWIKGGFYIKLKK